MADTVLSVASRAVLEACAALGLEAAALLAQAGAGASEVYDPDARLDAEVADGIWHAAYAAAGDPDLALRAAVALPFGAYKVLDFIVANAPTVRDALQRLCRYFVVVDQRARLQFHDGDPGRLVFEASAGPLPPPAQQYTLAAIVTRLRACTGTDLALERVDFTFPRPDDVAAYEEAFGCPLRFEAPAAAVSLSAATLVQRVEGANSALLSVLEDHAKRVVDELPRVPDSFVAQVRETVEAQLQDGHVAAKRVARKLGLSERTLQRRLQELGVGYAQLVAEVRRETAERYLRDRDIALCEVAWLLGFSEHSAFSRAFKRWTGRSPAHWRATHAPT